MKPKSHRTSPTSGGGSLRKSMAFSVRINGHPVATVDSSTFQEPFPRTVRLVESGSPVVLAENYRTARIGHSVTGGLKLVGGSPNVLM